MHAEVCPLNELRVELQWVLQGPAGMKRIHSLEEAGEIRDSTRKQYGDGSLIIRKNTDDVLGVWRCFSANRGFWYTGRM